MKKTASEPESFVWRKIKFAAIHQNCYRGHILDGPILIYLQVFNCRRGSIKVRGSDEKRYEASASFKPQGDEDLDFPIYGHGPTMPKALTQLLEAVRKYARLRRRLAGDTALLADMIANNTIGVRHGGLDLKAKPKKLRGKK